MIAPAPTVRVREATGPELEQWDLLVRRFGNHRVVHTRAWIQSLEGAGYGTPLYLVFERGGEPVGCVPGLLASVGPWRIFGSPRAGWETASMGPAYEPKRVSTTEMLDALVPCLAEEYGVRHIELLSSALEPDAMRAAGFHGEPVLTYRAPLFPGDPERTFRQLKDSARRNVRRAERLGLEVSFEADESFVDEHYGQLHDVYLRGGHTITFSKERVRTCVRHLRASGHLLTVSVYLPGGRVCIATGTFLIEGRELSLWMWAHRPHYRWYRPTELMTWSVMKRAMELGCETFDLTGRGDFKAKFGACSDASKMRWTWSRPRWLESARGVASAGYRLQQAVRGQVARLGGELLLPGRHRRRVHGPPLPCVLGDVDLVRALGLAGLKSVVVAPPGDPARFSRHARRQLPWNDPWDQPEALVDTLIAHSAAEPEPPVLFYPDDGTLVLVSRYRDRLGRAFRFVLPDAGLVEDLVDKARFQERAARLQLPVPPALALDPARDPAPSALDIPFPLVLKPSTRRVDRWRPLAGEHKALRVDEAAALRALWPALQAAGLPVLLQSLVPGPETSVESYHVYVDESGSTVAEFTGRKIRTWPDEFGGSCALEISDAPDVAALGREVIRRLELRGVAKLDFKRAPDGQLHLLEVNPRFTLWHHLGARAGVNIPALVYGDLVGWVRPPMQRVRSGVRWCRMWADREAARARGIWLAAWLPWVLGCQAKRALAWDDPLPLFGTAAWRWLARRRSAGPSAPPELVPAGGVEPVAEYRELS